jgi:hypothetical protein
VTSELELDEAAVVGKVGIIGHEVVQAWGKMRMI